MRLAWIVAVGLLAPGLVRAQTAEAPAITSNDTWTYKDTVERGTTYQQGRTEMTVVRAGASGLLVSQRPAGSNQTPREQLLGADWSRSRSVDGHETVVNRPLQFPLRSGRSWVVDYIETKPNREHSSEHFHTTLRVVGWEDVTVPAGTFHALKIEGDGEWQAALAPAVSAVTGARVDGQGATTVMQTNRVTPQTVTGRLYKAFWYVPGVKRWVKSVEEYYSGTGQRNERYTDELESYKVAG